ncbi:Mce-associated membrane protein [Nocardioides albertanoniae]|uniref:Mce-associated membrane protein n=1 Tax=Nocardioides albertanoniae TaxID=1175486 RepID=A0A543AD24_9ACTN|nr:DnaJ domain-containing protein [Nocardioides albertanoniae]TQL70491.1 Mce-associated membrane protein [Nocardioides albertanoniae]
MTSPTWYDLLDVEPDAATSDIRAAWKSAIADLDPTDRRFRRLNDAAAVLLDEDKRAAYDAELAEREDAAADEVTEDDSEDAAPEDTEAAAEEADEEAEVAPVATAADGEPDDDADDTDDAADAAGDADDDTDAADEKASSGRTLPLLPVWALVAAGALALAAVIAAGVVFFGQPKVTTVANNNVTKSTAEGAVGKEITRNHKLLVEEEGGDALAAAKKSVVPLLSYDYSKMDESKSKAHAVITKNYREDYDRLFAVLVDNVPETKTVVKTLAPVDAGVIRVSEDTVQVLVLVDRQVTNAQRSTPIGYQEYAMLTMAKSDDGWLVDKVETQPSQK